MRVVATIAALNEEKNLADVLDRMPEGIDVILIDDGSTDNSAEVAQQHGARVVYHPLNMGQGVAVFTGFRAALMGDYDVIVAMDGDGQHDPMDIPRFVERLQETDVDFVVGSRKLGSNYKGAPFFRRTFLPYFTWVINRITGYNLTDVMCGFRAYRASSLRSIQHVLVAMDEPQYTSVEMFIRFAHAGLIVDEVPIHLMDRRHGISHKGRHGLDDLMRYGGGVVYAMLRTLISLTDSRHKPMTKSKDRTG